MEKIFITGCAKSGTTLFKRMFWAYEKTWVVTNETTLDDFAKLKTYGDYDFVVAKRSWDTVFSSSRVTKEEYQRQIKLIQDNNIKIINIVRDGRDVVVSWDRDFGINGAFDWMESVKQTNDSNIILNVRYEDLVTNPDKVQLKIFQEFNMVPCADFSRYPEFIPDDYPLTKNPNYKLRPLETSKIGNEPQLYKELKPNDIEFFDKMLKEHGYL